MDSTEILGFMAAAFTTAASAPQAYKIIKTKSTKDVSLTMYILLLTGTCLWVCYGVMKNDLPLIVANIISSAISIIIITLKLTSKKTIETIHDKVIPNNSNLKGTN